MAERSVEELISAAEGTSELVAAALARLRTQASDNGVRVTVDVNGKLVGLEIDQQATHLAPAELSALISRLTRAAATAALAEGIITLANLGGALTKATLTAPTQPEAVAGDDWLPQTWQMS